MLIRITADTEMQESVYSCLAGSAFGNYIGIPLGKPKIYCLLKSAYTVQRRISCLWFFFFLSSSELQPSSPHGTSVPVCFALLDKPLTFEGRQITKIDRISCEDLGKFKHTKRFDSLDDYSYTALVGR